MTDQLLTIIGIVANVFIGLLQYFSSKKANKTEIINQADHQINYQQVNKTKNVTNIIHHIHHDNVLIRNSDSVKKSTDIDASVFILFAVFGAIIYYKYSTIVTILMSLTGILSTLSIFLYSKVSCTKKELIPTYTLFSLLFIAIYFFKFPVYGDSEFMIYSFGIGRFVFFVYQMASALVIESLFLLPIISIIAILLKKKPLFRPYSTPIVLLGFLLIFLSSGSFLHIIFKYFGE